MQYSIVFTLSGILIVVSDEHPLNAYGPISVIVFGNVTVFKYLQSSNPRSLY